MNENTTKGRAETRTYALRSMVLLYPPFAYP